jgi:hypothetical protein
MSYEKFIGQQCVMANGDEGVIVEAKAGPMCADGNSKVGSVRVRASVKFKVRMPDGTLIWTDPGIFDENDGPGAAIAKAPGAGS